MVQLQSVAFFLFSSKLVIIVMNTSQHSYLRAAALALGLAVLFYFIALSVVANTAAALLAGTAALISGLLTPLLQCRDQDASPKKECETKKSSPDNTQTKMLPHVMNKIKQSKTNKHRLCKLKLRLFCKK